MPPRASAVRPRVLLVDDDPSIQWSVGAALADAGHDVRPARSIGEAEPALRAGVDLVLLDLALPDGSGLDLLESAREDDPDLLVIVLTGASAVDSVVRAMKLGAFHYVTKPVNMDELLLLAETALETTRLRRELQTLRLSERSGVGIADSGLDRIVGQSEAIRKTRELLVRVAGSPASTVLITGETGTGKDLAARVIHDLSNRAGGPFSHITCSALAETLFEAELFGHERGAFTGAGQQRKGLLEQSHGGTVYLDEIGELSATVQAKLLRFLEDKTIRRLGGTADITVDVRVIAATNRDLNAAVAAGAFREDLFFRLQVLPVEVPALRARTGDVPLLAQHFADLFTRRFHKSLRSIAPESLDRLADYAWPGNVRELRNTMERAVLLCADAGELTPDDLLLPHVSAAASAPPVASLPATSGGRFVLPAEGIDLEQHERDLVRQALERTGGNQTKAAALLGMHRDQVRYRVSKFGLGDAGKTRSSE